MNKRIWVGPRAARMPAEFYTLFTYQISELLYTRVASRNAHGRTP
jgi:hypothetical protein